MAVIGLELNVDDTGTDPNGEVCGAGGYLATAEAWAGFVPAWQKALPADLQARFHFTKWVREVQRGRRDPAEIRPLLAAITTHLGGGNGQGFGRAIFWRDYNGRSDAEKRALHRPFNLCLVLAVEGALQAVKFMVGFPNTERLTVFCAELAGPREQGSAQEVFEEYRRARGIEDRVLSLHFRSMSYPQMQAADLIAHATYRRVLKLESHPVVDAALDEFLAGPSSINEGKFIDQEVLDEFFRRFPPQLRGATLRGVSGQRF